MSDPNKEFFYRNFLLQGRLFYPDILVPKPNKNGVLKYSALVAFKINSPENQKVLGEINAFLNEAKVKFHPSVPPQYFTNPLKKWGEYMRQDGKPMAEFLRDCFWINLTSGVNFKPSIIDRNMQNIIDPALIYSGMNVAVSISFYNSNGEKKGVGANLVAVMVTGGGDKELGAAAVDVNKVFGGFQADMGQQFSSPQMPQAPAYQHQGYPQQPAVNPQFGQAPAVYNAQPPVQQAYVPQAPAYGQQQWPPQAPAYVPPAQQAPVVYDASQPPINPMTGRPY